MGMENHPSFRSTPTITMSVVEALFDSHAARTADHTGAFRCQCDAPLANSAEHMAHIRSELMNQEVILLPAERLVYPLSVAVELMNRVFKAETSAEWKVLSRNTGLEAACKFLQKLERIFLLDGLPKWGIPVPDPQTGVVPLRYMDDPSLISGIAGVLRDHRCEQLALNSEGDFAPICSCGVSCSADSVFEHHRLLHAARRGVIFGRSTDMSGTAKKLVKVSTALSRSNFFTEQETATLSATSTGLAHLLDAMAQEKRSF